MSRKILHSCFTSLIQLASWLQSPLSPPVASCPPIQSSSIFIQKMASFPQISTKHGTASFSKTKNLPVLRLNKATQCEKKGLQSLRKSRRQALLPLWSQQRMDLSYVHTCYTCAACSSIFLLYDFLVFSRSLQKEND